MKRWGILAALGAAACAVSCSQQNREELEFLKKEDPQFESTVALKVRADREIAVLRSELARHKADFNAKVGALKTAYDEEAGRIGGGVKTLQSKCEAYRAVYRTGISDLSRTLEAKKNKSQELRSAFQDLRELLGRRGPIGLSSAESRSWEAKKEDLQKRIDELGVEIQRIESEIAQKRRKLKYL